MILTGKCLIMTDGFSATLLYADEISENMQIWRRGGGVWRGFVKLTLLVILCAERSIKNCPL